MSAANFKDEYSVSVDTDKLGSRLDDIAQYIKSRVFGQDRAIEHAVRRLAIFEAGLSDPTKPVGAMLFAGPTGVGKTWTAKVIAEAWIGGQSKKGRSPVVIIECGNMSQPHNIHTLIGSPPSYVGSELRPLLDRRNIERYAIDQLIDEYYKDPVDRAKRGMPPKEINNLMARLSWLIAAYHGAKSVVVFDEIEKAHPEILNVLLNILQEGKITLANGTETDLSRTLFILTTNVGSREIRRLIEGNIFGYNLSQQKVSRSNDLDEEIYRRTKTALEKEFLPELLSRLSQEIIVFHALEYKHYQAILRIILGAIAAKFSGKDDQSPPLLISYSDEFITFLLEKGTDPRFGARTLEKVVERNVLYPIASALLSGEIRAGEKIRFTIVAGKPVLKRARRPRFVKLEQFKSPAEKPPLDIEGYLIQWGFLEKRSKSGAK